MEITNNFKKRAIDAVLALGTPKVMLLDASHITDVDTDDNIDDVSANEISSANYTAGGQALANVTSVLDLANDRVDVDCDDPSWTNLTATIKAAAIYVDTGVPATSPIIGIVTFGSNQSPATQDFTLTVPAGGFYRGTSV